MSYLNKKYQVKSHTFTRTEPQFYDKNNLAKKDNAKGETLELATEKYQQRQRPSTSKPSRNQEDKHAKTAHYEKQHLKVLYDKVSKIEEKKPKTDHEIHISNNEKPYSSNKGL